MNVSSAAACSRLTAGERNFTLAKWPTLLSCPLDVSPETIRKIAPSQPNQKEEEDENLSLFGAGRKWQFRFPCFNRELAVTVCDIFEKKRKLTRKKTEIQMQSPPRNLCNQKPAMFSTHTAETWSQKKNKRKAITRRPFLFVCTCLSKRKWFAAGRVRRTNLIYKLCGMFVDDPCLLVDKRKQMWKPETHHSLNYYGRRVWNQRYIHQVKQKQTKIYKYIRTIPIWVSLFYQGSTMKLSCPFFFPRWCSMIHFGAFSRPNKRRTHFFNWHSLLDDTGNEATEN